MTNEELEEKFLALEREQDPSIDKTVLKLNVRIQQALASYFAEHEPIEFRFDLPEEKPQHRTISIFLYNIQEDLQLRSAQARTYDLQSQSLQPGWVHLRCCYLITYWPEEVLKTYARVPWDGESHKAMNRVLNALLNQRTFKGLPSVYTRVIPPTEGLNSLSNFWQALGHEPRLCLSYEVTIPMRLAPPIDERVPLPFVDAPTVTLEPVDLNKEPSHGNDDR